MRVRGHSRVTLPECPRAWPTTSGSGDGSPLTVPETDAEAAASYHPTPFDTSKVKMTPAIRDLVNLLARQTHEVWARDKFEEGWKYAPDR